MTTTPDDLTLWRRRQEAGEPLPWEGVRLLDDGERPALLDHGYLTDADRANPDVMANVGAIDETAALITWVAEDEDEPQAWGYWRGPDDAFADRPPVVSYDSEGQFYLQPGANLTEVLCSAYGEWADDGYEGLAEECRRLGVEVSEDDPITLPNPDVSPTPAGVHRAAYDRLLAEG
ncbi:hypothetical protein GCM10023340_02370 [Nocardioides marinquilinus]|uniref:Uncharacterized protein n=1 Tax=Nocardioides marinquilinus TaxID=1210400 RepID=A0ABP9P5I3_9ACTN